MRRDEERERSLISFDGEDNNNNTKKKKDTFFLRYANTRKRDYYTPRMGRDLLPLSFSLSLSI